MKKIKIILSAIGLLALATCLLIGPAMLVCCVWLDGDLYPKIAASYGVVALTGLWFQFIADWASKYK